METEKEHRTRHGMPTNEPTPQSDSVEHCDRQNRLAAIEASLDYILTLTVALREQGELLRVALLREDADCYRNALHFEARLASTQQSAEEARQILDQLIAMPPGKTRLISMPS